VAENSEPLSSLVALVSSGFASTVTFTLAPCFNWTSTPFSSVKLFSTRSSLIQMIRPLDGDLCFFGFAGKRRFYDLLDSSGPGRTRLLSHGSFGVVHVQRVTLRKTLSFRCGRSLFKNAQFDHASVSSFTTLAGYLGDSF